MTRGHSMMPLPKPGLCLYWYEHPHETFPGSPFDLWCTLWHCLTCVHRPARYIDDWLRWHYYCFTCNGNQERPLFLGWREHCGGKSLEVYQHLSLQQVQPQYEAAVRELAI